MSDERLSELELNQARLHERVMMQDEHYNKFMEQTTKVYESVNSLTAKVDVMVSKFDTVSESQKDHEKRIRAVEDVISSNKAWDSIKNSMLGALGSAFVAGAIYIISIK